MAATLRDAEGNPIQLTDEHGNPVQLTDEHGNPMHLSGVAYSTAPDVPTTWPKVHGGDTEETYVGGGGVGGDQYRPQRPTSGTTAGEAYAYSAPTAVVGAGEPYQPQAKVGVGEIHRSSTSSSSVRSIRLSAIYFFYLLQRHVHLTPGRKKCRCMLYPTVGR
ncbi:hypothetical protein Droror1_Dr00006617 [Drosera rotundifolia]